ncbi:hypothetical protein PG991_013518 [Apiospora marii]|uniref:BTB domain-containing protein n=1 Tax=Apiospora marii TaxID=335849 RepID=A0ABR1R6A2_9PEZI
MPAAKDQSLGDKGNELLRQTKNYSDVKVRCRGCWWNLHRAILSRCAWFENQFDMLGKGNEMEIHLEDFPVTSVRTFLCFIYNKEIRHASLKPKDKKFDYEVHAELYNMGTYFNFPSFKVAVLDMGEEYFDKWIRRQKSDPTMFADAEINDLLSAVGIAYSGSKDDQSALREMYVHFFTECFICVKKDQYFHDALRLVMPFAIDLMKSVNRKAGSKVMSLPTARTPAKPSTTAPSSTDSDTSTDSDSDSESDCEPVVTYKVTATASGTKATASATRVGATASATGPKATAKASGTKTVDR